MCKNIFYLFIYMLTYSHKIRTKATINANFNDITILWMFCVLLAQAIIYSKVVVPGHIYSLPTGQCQTPILDDPRTFHCDNYFVVGRIHTCSEVSTLPVIQCSCGSFEFLPTEFASWLRPLRWDSVSFIQRRKYRTQNVKRRLMLSRRRCQLTSFVKAIIHSSALAAETLLTTQRQWRFSP